ncbi:hypothetical protein H696_05431 [Fonticula alba]|uniref:Uncharacterized protein n=1 Tax=Fonticula alba TaxID=691883 RepID=A0A058Z249_FONAL|nr:hypothetical protein H696_05431 [Fonticula alba]KCV67973.1 hypothetical protein H696_05431 [Fonticula alba]|eukprot:XP_009497540.1 hypothetical protein H696_05431 [Fonticula alba]
MPSSKWPVTRRRLVERARRPRAALASPRPQTAKYTVLVVHSGVLQTSHLGSSALGALVVYARPGGPHNGRSPPGGDTVPEGSPSAGRRDRRREHQEEAPK